MTDYSKEHTGVLERWHSELRRQMACIEKELTQRRNTQGVSPVNPFLNMREAQNEDPKQCDVKSDQSNALMGSLLSPREMERLLKKHDQDIFELRRVDKKIQEHQGAVSNAHSTAIINLDAKCQQHDEKIKTLFAMIEDKGGVWTAIGEGAKRLGKLEEALTPLPSYQALWNEQDGIRQRLDAQWQEIVALGKANKGLATRHDNMRRDLETMNRRVKALESRMAKDWDKKRR